MAVALTSHSWRQLKQSGKQYQAPRQHLRLKRKNYEGNCVASADSGASNVIWCGSANDTKQGVCLVGDCVWMGRLRRRLLRLGRCN